MGNKQAAEKKTLDEQLESIALLEKDWDGYGADPINAAVIDRLRSISFSPMSSGGIMMELFDSTHSATISLSEDGEIESVEFGKQ